MTTPILRKRTKSTLSDNGLHIWSTRLRINDGWYFAGRDDDRATWVVRDIPKLVIYFVYRASTSMVPGRVADEHEKTAHMGRSCWFVASCFGENGLRIISENRSRPDTVWYGCLRSVIQFGLKISIHNYVVQLRLRE